ncbi:sensor histidine kinase [Nocardioides pacificus]
MAEEHAAMPHALPGGRSDASVDHRVAAVLEVLAGRSAVEVARLWSVDVAVLHRWVRAFVDAGTAQVTNTPTAEAAQQRDRFLAAFAHELRTPLAVAQGWVTMMHEDVLPPAARDGAVRRTHEALERLAGRVRDVELLVAASLGRLTLEPRPVRLGEMVEELSGVGTVGGEGADVVLTVDPELFARVLRDLWEAAGARPTPRSRRLVVSTVEPWVEVRVERDADPIEPHLLQALFEPFDLNDDGTGITIGLYLARALTVAHGGTVGVDQDEDGAVLWVRVPCSDEGATDRRRPESTVEES